MLNFKFFYNLVSWPIVILFLFLVNYLLVFNFSDLTDFRDFRMIVPNTSTSHFLSSNFYLHTVYNFWLNFGFELTIFWQLIFSLLFTFGVLFNYIFLVRFYNLFVNSDYQKKPRQLILFNLNFLLLSLIFFYNPFTLERLLMGHYFFILGQVLFIPTFYFWTRWFVGFFDFYKTNKLSFSRNLFSKDFGILFALISLIQFLSIHHGVFLYFWLGLSFLFLIILKFLITNPTSKTEQNSFLEKLNPKKIFDFQALVFCVQVFLIILFNGIIFLLRFLQFYNSAAQNITELSQRNDIVQNFSLQLRGDTFSENLILASLGKGAWMSPFDELSGVRESLGIWTDFSLYFSFIFGFLVFMVVGIWLFLFMFSNFKLGQKKALENSIIFVLLSGLIITWTLNFGYSNDFRFINQLFYLLPGSYTFREAGKFYGFFLGFLVLLLTLSFTRINSKKRFYQIFITSFLGLVLFSNFLPFAVISQNYNYVNYPEIFNRTNQSCQQEKKKILFLPQNLYLVPSYSQQVFVINPSLFLLPECEVLNTNFATLQNFSGGENLLLNSSDVGLELNQILEKYSRSEISNSVFIENLKEFLLDYSVDYLIIEIYPNNNLKKINTALSLEFNRVDSEGTIFWYDVVAR